MFEVSLEDAPGAGHPAQGRTAAPIRVAAKSWLGAWLEAQRQLGGREEPRDPDVTLRSDGSVRVTAAGAGEAWIVRELGGGDGVAAGAAPAPAAVKPRDRSRRVGPKIDPAGGGGRDVDPVARALSDLERQRLLARPVRIASDTGLPKAIDPAPRGPRRRRESTRLGLCAMGVRPGDGAASRAVAVTAEHSAVEPDSPLPQQFRAVVAPAMPGAGAAAEALGRAIETAWGYVPCQTAQILRRLPGGALRVVAARGERERELVACTLMDPEALPALARPRPSRVKFGAPHEPLRYRSQHDATHALPVVSAITVPLRAEGAPWGVVLLLNTARPSGFTEGELSAVTYLARTIEAAL